MRHRSTDAARKDYVDQQITSVKANVLSNIYGDTTNITATVAADNSKTVLSLNPNIVITQATVSGAVSGNFNIATKQYVDSGVNPLTFSSFTTTINTLVGGSVPAVISGSATGSLVILYRTITSNLMQFVLNINASNVTFGNSGRWLGVQLPHRVLTTALSYTSNGAITGYLPCTGNVNGNKAAVTWCGIWTPGDSVNQTNYLVFGNAAITSINAFSDSGTAAATVALYADLYLPIY